MLVTQSELAEVCGKLSRKKLLALDTETTGLRGYHGDRPFCIVIADATDTYYLNLHPDHPGLLTDLSPLAGLLTKDILWGMHNATFDLSMLRTIGLGVSGPVHDTAVVARLVRNDRVSLSLEACAKEIGAEKSKAVEDYVEKNKLFTRVEVPGKSKRDKRLHYDKVPFAVIRPYAEQDVRVTYDLMLHQIEVMQRIVHKESRQTWPSLLNVYENEKELVKVILGMESNGAPVDLDYCETVADFEASRMHEAAEDFRKQSGKAFKNSGKLFTEIFEGEKFVYGKETKTGKVNPSFDSDVLAGFKSPLAKIVLNYRDAKSRSDFVRGFIYHADAESKVHTSFNSAGTVTGRFSSSGPNLQNLSKPHEGDTPETFPIRRAFIPPPGEALVMFDYEQMEYRLLLDYIGSKALIEKVLQGHDVHQATALLAGITRQQAKTVNFALIYGSGINALAKNLKVSVHRAQEIKEAIFSVVPELREFVQKVQHKAEKRGYVFNWFGRRCLFDDKRFAYRSVNHMIQGGCADVVKLAMVRIGSLLRGRRTKLILTIHDELIFTSPPEEFHILPKIREIMETVYRPVNGLRLTCGVDHSFTSLADKVEGYPHGEKARVEVQGKSSGMAKEASTYIL